MLSSDLSCSLRPLPVSRCPGCALCRGCRRKPPPDVRVLETGHPFCTVLLSLTPRTAPTAQQDPPPAPAEKSPPGMAVGPGLCGF